MRRTPVFVVAAGLATIASALVPSAARATTGTDRPYAAPATPGITVSVVTLHFNTLDDVVNGGTPTHCDVIGDLYIPSTASKTHPVPAILTTNGFGGSKNDQAYIGEEFGKRGYAVLSYTGLGFGPNALGAPNPSTVGSGCKIELDSPEWDGQAGAQLVEFLGGKPGIAYRSYDPTTGVYSSPYPAPNYVISDTPTSHLAFDPRVGMVGGSYGGEIQYAVADASQRVDAIIPVITWNDLAYSLAPNDTSFARTAANPAGVTYATAGTEKSEWTSLFFGEGILDGVDGLQAQPSRNVGCPNFDNQACTAKSEMDALGYPDPTTLAFARQASVESYLANLHVPTLLMQGQSDTLFDLQESVATYEAMRVRGVPVHLVWQSWGHSNGTPAKGELDTANDGSSPLSTYEGTLIAAWFDKYLKHDPRANTGAPFQYFQDWQPASTSGPDWAQYASAAAFPVAGPVAFHLSGTGALLPASEPVVAGTVSFAVSQAATSYSETSAVQPDLPNQGTTPSDLPGTFAAFTSTPLAKPVIQVGSPELTLHLSAPSWAASQTSGNPASQLLLFAKIYDVSPSGTVDLVRRLIAPFRVPDVTAPVHVELPAVVHRYPAGDRIELVVAAADAAYQNNRLTGPVSVVNAAATPNILTLPLLSATGSGSVSAAQLLPATTPPTATHPTASGPTGTLPATGLPLAVGLAGMLTLGAALLLRRVLPGS